MNAETINNALRDKLQEKCKVYPQNNLRCSSIGHPCWRYVYLSITNWEDKPAPDVGLQGIFDLGNTLEEHVINHIKAAGFEVITPTAHSFRIDPQGITGREDLRIKDPETGELIPVEVKSISPFEFDKLNCFEDFVNAKKPYIRAYAAQIQLYMLKFGKEYAFFALINKLTGAIKFIRVEFDYDFCEIYSPKRTISMNASRTKHRPKPATRSDFVRIAICNIFADNANAPPLIWKSTGNSKNS